MSFVGQIWHFNVDRTVRAAFEYKVVEQGIVIATRGGGDDKIGVEALLGKGEHLLPVATAKSYSLGLISGYRRENASGDRVGQLQEIVLTDGDTLKEVELQVGRRLGKRNGLLKVADTVFGKFFV